jgi:polysaccharide biosynthesis/export protein
MSKVHLAVITGNICVGPCGWSRYWHSLAIWLTIILLHPLLQGCAAPVVNLTAPPPPAAQADPSEYRIHPGDQMEIKFFYTPELNELVTVRPDGRISLQLVQDITVAGLSPAELTQALTRKYARELKHPEITVIMRTFEGQRIYVDGEVHKPGVVPFVARMTLLQSVSVAGGLKDTARSDEILLLRRGPEGKPEVFTLDLTRVFDGSDIGQDISLKPFDIVYVPKSAIANLDLWVDQYLRQSLPIGFGLGYNLGN